MTGAMGRLCLAAWVAAISCVFAGPGDRGDRRYTIETTGTARAAPDLLHLMMKMEYESGLAADAATLGEQRLSQFLAAVDDLRLPDLTCRVVNNVITPAETGAGVAYTRNIVFTLPNPAGEPAARDLVVAKLEDLGARYNSHCVTCIGSG